MAGFMYFMPGRQSASLEDMRAAGLGYVFDGQFTRTQILGNGPDGGAGLLCAHGANHDLAFRPERQEWFQPHGKACWIGMESASKPTPADLARERMIGPYSVPCGDGARWTVPTAVKADGSCPLPSTRRIEPKTGEIVKRPEPLFDTLRLAADMVSESIRNHRELSTSDEVQHCATALTINYRVSKDELCALGILTDEAVVMILFAMCDRLHWPDLDTSGVNADGVA